MTNPKKLVRAFLAVLLVSLCVSHTNGAEAVSETLSPDLREAVHRLAILDWIVIAFYGLGVLGIGWYFSRRSKTSEQYLLGGRTMSSWAVGLSLFATMVSSLGFISTPGEIIRNGPMILSGLAAVPITLTIIGWFIIPYIMRMKVTSAYEILELRLGTSVRLLGSGIFLLLRLLWMSVIIYATTSKVLIPLTGLDVGWTPMFCILLGTVTLVYTSMGGFRAVIWTDVLQTVILFSGALLALLTVTIALGGVDEWWPKAWPDSWPAPKWGFQTDTRIAFGWAVTSAAIWWISTACSDQMAIQRFLSTRDAKTARRVMLVTATAETLVAVLLALVGIALFGYFQANSHLVPEGRTLYDSADELFPRYIVFALPAGLTGLVVAGLLAAAMSSLSSGVNSASTVITIDYVRRFWRKNMTDAQLMRVAKFVSVGVGAIVVTASLGVMYVPGNLIEVVYRVVNLLAVPLFILFFLALFVPWATPFGTWTAEIFSIATAVLIAFWPLILDRPGPSFMLMMPVTFAVGATTGMLASLLPLGPRPRARLNDLIAPTIEESAAATRPTQKR